MQPKGRGKAVKRARRVSGSVYLSSFGQQFVMNDAQARSQCLPCSSTSWSSFSKPKSLKSLSLSLSLIRPRRRRPPPLLQLWSITKCEPPLEMLLLLLLLLILPPSLSSSRKVPAKFLPIKLAHILTEPEQQELQ